VTTQAVQEDSSNAHTRREETLSSGIVIPESGEVTIPSYGVLGVRVHPLQVPDILRVLDHWIQERRRVHCVCSTGMHGASEVLENPKFKELLNRMDLNNMDGVPMKLLARIHGFKYAQRRSPGPEVMGTLLLETGPKYKHFFYGNRVSEELARLCAKKYGTRVVGIYPSRRNKGSHRPSSRSRPILCGARWAR
jgi:UDP-N-acetyl-D-mannosaminuronic acid transferase (WecB/TagA/CpsF family)